MDEETVVGDRIITTLNLRLATWLYQSSARLTAITPAEASRCAFTFTLSNSKSDQLMNQWANGNPQADVREAINGYLYLVHRGKETLRARGGR